MTDQTKVARSVPSTAPACAGQVPVDIAAAPVDIAAAVTAAADAAAVTAVVDAAVVTADMAEAALTEMEGDRIGYRERHQAAAHRITALAREIGHPGLGMRARLICADIALRQGSTLQAGQQAEAVLADATRTGDAFAMARSCFLLSEVHHALGDSPAARINGMRSVELLPEDAQIGVRIDHLRALATALGPGPEARRCHIEALDLVAVTGDVPRTIGIHNGYSYCAYQAGEREIAVTHAERMLELSRLRHIPLLASQVDTVARARMMQGRTEAAVALLHTVVPHDIGSREAAAVNTIVDHDPKPYGLPECLLTLADAHRDRGRFVSARRVLDVALQMAQQRRLGLFRARVIESEARLYADIGDYRRAFESHRAFHAAMTALRSDEDETRARIMQASFDAGEEQRDAEDYQELALRDALTGLYNRRFIDEHLAAACAAAADRGEPLSVAIVDADFFKRINDEISHQAGDTVLRTLAATLAATCRDDETVGRLGGEEFVILLPGRDAEAAYQRCEEFRHTIARVDWSALTGAIPVTVSIGVSTAPGGAATATALMTSADQNLYAAKRSGRDRVMSDAI